jgi:hypothetical protein
MEQVEIRVRGQIDTDWSEWLGGLRLTPTENGETVLAGPVRDQAALQGLLERLAALGLHLVSLNARSE